MIYELEPSRYGLVRPLFQGLWYYLAIFSVLEGNSPGWVVVVDDVDVPRAAFVWDQVEGGLCPGGDAGDSAFSRALNTWILDEVYPEAREIPWALLGENDVALENLYWARDDGWRDWISPAENDALADLRQTPTWRALVETAGDGSLHHHPPQF